MNGNLILLARVIDAILLGVTMLPEARQALDLLAARLRLFIAEGRDPTPEEWAALNAEIEGKLARLITARDAGRVPPM
jgi:hypothetical protein